jgi:hypothetical protein
LTDAVLDFASRLYDWFGLLGAGPGPQYDDKLFYWSDMFGYPVPCTPSRQFNKNDVCNTSFIFRPIQSSLGGSMSAFRVFSFGSADVPIEAAFTGTVAAPLATIRLQANAPHAGAFFGMGIFVQAGTIIRHVGFPAWGTQPPPPGQIPRRIPTPSVPPKGCGQPPPNVGPFPPPSSGANNPWDLFQIMLKACRGDSFPTPRKSSYLPYLVVRANPADRGQRPLPAGTVFWESPDVFVMPNQPVNGAPAVPANLGGMAQAGVPNTIFAHVWNLGNAPAFDVIVEFYWFNPTLGIELSDANYIGRSVVSLGPKTSIKSHLSCAVPSTGCRSSRTTATSAWWSVPSRSCRIRCPMTCSLPLTAATSLNATSRSCRERRLRRRTSP